MINELVKNKENDIVLSFKEQLKIAQEYADAVENSIFGKQFETLVSDPNNPEKQIIKVKKEDIVSCILLGRELGLTDMVSISMGKSLDKLAFFQVAKGKSLGLDTTTSLQNIFAYERDGKIITGIDGQGINAIILRAGITYKVLDDFKSKKYYRDSKTKMFLGYEFDENWIIVNRGINSEKLKEAISLGKYPVFEEITFFTRIEFNRVNWEPHIETYSLLDATEAGLYRGIDFYGNEIKGKPAWNSNPKRILTTRVISIGGSRIGGDALKGMISLDELNELKDTIDIKHEEV